MLEAFQEDRSSIVKYQKLYKYAYILSDGIFKMVFAGDGDRERLISLLNAMLELDGKDRIRELSLEMQEYPGVFDKKTCLLDIIGTTDAGEKVLIEVQQKGDYLFRDRVEYYIARVIENQVHKSEQYRLPKIYFLGILDFEMFPEFPTEYLHHVDETCRGKKFFPKIQKVFVEVSKFFDLERRGLLNQDNSPAADWLRAFKGIINEEPVPERILKNPVFERLFDEILLTNFKNEVFNVEVHNMTDLKYEHECGFLEGQLAGQKEGRIAGLEEGRLAGLAAGREEGRIAGLEAGRKEGLAAGREEGRIAGLEAGRKEGLAAGREEGRIAGLEAGRKEGLAAGREEGRIAGLEAGRKEGLAAGREAGRKEGLAAGREAGKKEGKKEASRNMAKAFLSLGKLTAEEISKCTGISVKELQELE